MTGRKFPSRSPTKLLKSRPSAAEEGGSEGELRSKAMTTMIKDAVAELDLRTTVLLAGGTVIAGVAAWSICLARIWMR